MLLGRRMLVGLTLAALLASAAVASKLFDPERHEKRVYQKSYENLMTVWRAHNAYAGSNSEGPATAADLTGNSFGPEGPPLSPFGNGRISIVNPGDTVEPGDIVFVPADMTYTEYDENQNVVRVETSRDGFWLVASGDGTQPYNQAFDGPSLKDLTSLGALNPVCVVSSQIEGYTGDPFVLDQVESLSSAWHRAMNSQAR